MHVPSMGTLHRLVSFHLSALKGSEETPESFIDLLTRKTGKRFDMQLSTAHLVQDVEHKKPCDDSKGRRNTISR